MNTGNRHPRPWYALTLDGRNITPLVSPILENLTLIDKRGFEADELDLTLDDSDGRLEIPPRGARLHVALGWHGEALVDKGSFVVDEVEHSGAPDRLTIRARSADLRTGLATKREQSWHDVTVGSVVGSIAGRSGLIPVIAESLATERLAHIDQTDESDAHLLTRLARDLDAIATVKGGRLLFMPTGGATTASGLALPGVTITRRDGDAHRFHVADRNAYTGVRAYWHDTRTGRKEEVVEGDDQAPDDPETTEPSAGNVKTLRHTFPTDREAENAARSEWQRLQRGVAEFTLTLARGRPELFPEMPARVRGFKPQIDRADWLIAEATHRLTDAGLTTALVLEIQN